MGKFYEDRSLRKTWTFRTVYWIIVLLITRCNRHIRHDVHLSLVCISDATRGSRSTRGWYIFTLGYKSWRCRHYRRIRRSLPKSEWKNMLQALDIYCRNASTFTLLENHSKMSHFTTLYVVMRLFCSDCPTVCVISIFSFLGLHHFYIVAEFRLEPVISKRTSIIEQNQEFSSATPNLILAAHWKHT